MSIACGWMSFTGQASFHQLPPVTNVPILYKLQMSFISGNPWSLMKSTNHLHCGKPIHCARLFSANTVMNYKAHRSCPYQAQPGSERHSPISKTLGKTKILQSIIKWVLLLQEIKGAS